MKLRTPQTKSTVTPVGVREPSIRSVPNPVKNPRAPYWANRLPSFVSTQAKTSAQRTPNNIGRAAFHESQVVPQIPARARKELIRLSDPSTVNTMRELRGRVKALNNIFTKHDDPRGSFTSMYRVITNGAVDTVERNLYEDNEWGADLTVNFGQRYLVNLHGHLTNGSVTPGWQRYYDLASEPNPNRKRIAAMGATIHLIDDLPQSLVDINSAEARRKDFMLFGENLLNVYSEMVAATRQDHKVDMSELFGLSGLGDLIDFFKGSGTATGMAYQGVRRKSWDFSRWLIDGRAGLARAEINASWRVVDCTLAKMDKLNLL